MAKKLVCTVEVSEPGDGESDYETEILELIAGAFVNMVSLLEYAANNTFSTTMVTEADDG